MKTDDEVNDLTCNPLWLEQHSDRLMGYEILRMFCRGDHKKGMKPMEIYDRIGITPNQISLVIKGIKNKAHAAK